MHLPRPLEVFSFRVTRFLFGFRRGVCARLADPRTRAVAEILRSFGAEVGRNVRVLPPLQVHNVSRSFRNLALGDESFVGRDCFFDLAEPIRIGARATLAMRVTLITHTDAGASRLTAGALPRSTAPVTIDEDAYVGAGSTVLQGTRIGSGAIVGAGALVRGDVPTDTLAVGVPARVVRTLGR